MFNKERIQLKSEDQGHKLQHLNGLDLATLYNTIELLFALVDIYRPGCSMDFK